MEIADTIAGCLMLGGIFLSCTIMNYRILYMRVKKAERIPSPAPLIGGIAGAILVFCLVGLKYPILLFVPLVIDPGCIPLIIWFLICMIMDFKG